MRWDEGVPCVYCEAYSLKYDANGYNVEEYQQLFVSRLSRPFSLLSQLINVLIFAFIAKETYPCFRKKKSRPHSMKNPIHNKPIHTRGKLVVSLLLCLCGSTCFIDSVLVLIIIVVAWCNPTGSIYTRCRTLEGGVQHLSTLGWGCITNSSTTQT